MIRWTMLRGHTAKARDFESVDELLKALEDEMRSGGEALVRLPDDAALFALEIKLVELQGKAVRSAQLLVGSSATLWVNRDPAMAQALGVGAMMNWPMADGGWCVRLVGMNIATQAQQPALQRAQ